MHCFLTSFRALISQRRSGLETLRNITDCAACLGTSLINVRQDKRSRTFLTFSHVSVAICVHSPTPIRYGHRPLGEIGTFRHIYLTITESAVLQVANDSPLQAKFAQPVLREYAGSLYRRSKIARGLNKACALIPDHCRSLKPRLTVSWIHARTHIGRHSVGSLLQWL